MNELDTPTESPDLPPSLPPGASQRVPVLGADAQPEITAGDIAKVAAARDRVLGEIRKRIVGQSDVVDLLLTALFSQGHGLFIGVPGLAKTLLIQTLSEAVSLAFNRIQFTPDLMPSDITGTDVLEQDATTGSRYFKFIQGPLFCNILLADEINRTPPKTQAALLQAMQERRVTAAGKTYRLDAPFCVFATQNPIEQEGTYPLPEAQLDRFMFSIRVTYPSFEEEVEVVTRTTGRPTVPVVPVLSREELLEMQRISSAVVAAPDVVRFAVEAARRTRPDNPEAPEMVKRYVSWGAGPRASQYLIIGARTRAALHGRPHASRDDVRALAHSVLAHRMLLSFQAEADRIGTDAIVEAILASIPHSRIA
jgi:MoxR-like ATPase